MNGKGKKKVKEGEDEESFEKMVMKAKDKNEQNIENESS